jgi:hypothetical protein
LLALTLVSALGRESRSRLIRQDEEPILNDMRTVQGGEASYSAGNIGFYGPLACLAAPTTCLANYPPGAPPFLSKTLAGLVEENGYARHFFEGKPQNTPPYPVLGKGSIVAWAYTAVPTTDKAGRRALCADSTGRICVDLDGRAPQVTAAQCPSPCERVK